jgi:hypothetical protein
VGPLSADTPERRSRCCARWCGIWRRCRAIGVLMVVSPGFVTGDLDRQKSAIVDAALRAHIGRPPEIHPTDPSLGSNGRTSVTIRHNLSRALVLICADCLRPPRPLPTGARRDRHPQSPVRHPPVRFRGESLFHRVRFTRADHAFPRSPATPTRRRLLYRFPESLLASALQRRLPGKDRRQRKRPLRHLPRRPERRLRNETGNRFRRQHLRGWNYRRLLSNHPSRRGSGQH